MTTPEAALAAHVLYGTAIGAGLLAGALVALFTNWRQ